MACIIDFMLTYFIHFHKMNQIILEMLYFQTASIKSKASSIKLLYIFLHIFETCDDFIFSFSLNILMMLPFQKEFSINDGLLINVMWTYSFILIDIKCAFYIASFSKFNTFRFGSRIYKMLPLRVQLV